MKYHDITKDDMKNGDGLRAVLWLSGCEHACPGCQNPITWDPDDGLDFDDKAFLEITEYLSRDYSSGLTLSGGDPLFPGNRSGVTKLLRKIRDDFPQKSVWCYTGYLWEEVRALECIKYIDVLVDGRFVSAKADNQLCWRGSSNQRVIDVQKSLELGTTILHCEEVYYEQNR